MNAELAKKRIASYLRGDITKDELDEFINGFGDDLTEEAYSEFLIEEFEKFIAAENTDEPDPENTDAAQATSQTEQKKEKTNRFRRFMYRRSFSLCMKETTSFLFTALHSFEFKYLTRLLSVSENLLTLKINDMKTSNNSP